MRGNGEYFHNFIDAIKIVYTHKIYYFLTLLFAIIVYSFNTILHNYEILFAHFSLKFLIILLWGSPQSMSFASYLILSLIAILGGMTFSMGTFLVMRQIAGGAGAGLAGVISGLLTPACPACALGLAGILGFGGFLTALPFKGLELGVIGILILLGSSAYLSSKIVSVCEIKAVPPH